MTSPTATPALLSREEVERKPIVGSDWYARLKQTALAAYNPSGKLCRDELAEARKDIDRSERHNLALEGECSRLSARIASLERDLAEEREQSAKLASNVLRHGERCERLEGQLQRIIDHWDACTELYTNDADLAANIAAIARAALEQT